MPSTPVHEAENPTHSCGSECEGQSPSRVPVAPLGDAGGKGDFYSEPGTAALAADVSLVARALGSAARYPISAEKRQALVNWVGEVFEKSRDDRVRSKCAATLLAADKLNLEVARLMIEEERLRIAKPPMATGCGGVTVIIEGIEGPAPRV